MIYAGVQPSALLGLSSCLLFPAASLVIHLCDSFLLRLLFYTLDQARFTMSAFARTTGARNKGSRFSRNWSKLVC
jgi:hypothetical protein